jgi:hypothetical protein
MIRVGPVATRDTVRSRATRYPERLRPIRHYYLGDQDEILRAAQQAVAKQGKAH